MKTFTGEQNSHRP